MRNNDFANWLTGEINRLGWSQSELARRAGLSSGLISQVLSGQKPGERFCKGVARALGVPEDEVFRRAGILSFSVSDLKERSLKEVMEWALKLNPEERKQLVTLARGIIAGREP